MDIINTKSPATYNFNLTFYSVFFFQNIDTSKGPFQQVYGANHGLPGFLLHIHPFLPALRK